jgi:hypothetical protein
VIILLPITQDGNSIYSISFSHFSEKGLKQYTLHDELVSDVQVKEAQADEKWSFVGKKRESLHR